MGLLKKILVQVWQDFTKNSTTTKEACALTYYTLLSIVPMLAIFFAIAKGFGLKKLLEYEIAKMLSGQEEIMQNIFSFVDNLLSNTNGGLIAVVSILFLMYSTISLMNNISNSFNKIWKVKKPRRLKNRLSDYLAILILVPFVIILTTGVTSFIESQSQLIIDFIDGGYIINNLILFLFSLVPYIIMIVFISLLFIVIPETKVSTKSAIISGIISGILFYSVEWFFINFQIGISKYNSIYGGFAALPLFFMWLQTAWTILLMGVHLSNKIHYYGSTEENEKLEDMNHYDTKKYSLVILKKIIECSINDKKPPTKKVLYQEVNCQNSIINRSLEVLTQSNLIIKTVIKNKTLGYRPYSDFSKLDVITFLDKIEHLENAPSDNNSYKQVDKIYENLVKRSKSLNENILIVDIKV